MAYSAHVAAVQDTPVDPTLIDALGNPRERMNVLKFEDIIASFVQSRSVCWLCCCGVSNKRRLTFTCVSVLGACVLLVLGLGGRGNKQYICRDDVLETPPLSSYHRLLVYRLASRFQLEHAKSENVSMEVRENTRVLYCAYFS